MSLNRYDIRIKINEGGVGAVYRSFDRSLNRVVVIQRDLAERGHDDTSSASGHSGFRASSRSPGLALRLDRILNLPLHGRPTC